MFEKERSSISSLLAEEWSKVNQRQIILWKIGYWLYSVSVTAVVMKVTSSSRKDFFKLKFATNNLFIIL